MNDPEIPARETGDPPRGFRVHPLDLLVLVLALSLAALAYAYLFRSSPAARPVDPFLGSVIEVEFKADREWKERFPPRGAPVLLEEVLVADVEQRAPSPEGGPGTVRLRLRVRERNQQKPEAMTGFRKAMRVGSTVQLSAGNFVVPAEVILVAPAREGR